MRGSSEELKGFCALTQRVCVVFVGMAGDAGSSQARALVQARSLSGRSGRLDGGLNPGSPIPGRLAPRSSFRGTLPALLSSPPRRRVVQEPQGSRPRASLSGDRVLPGYLLCLLGGESWALPFWYRLMAELALLSLCAPPPMRTRVGTLALEDPPVQGKLEAALREESAWHEFTKIRDSAGLVGQCSVPVVPTPNDIAQSYCYLNPATILGTWRRSFASLPAPSLPIPLCKAIWEL